MNIEQKFELLQKQIDVLKEHSHAHEEYGGVEYKPLNSKGMSFPYNPDYQPCPSVGEVAEKVQIFIDDVMIKAINTVEPKPAPAEKECGTIDTSMKMTGCGVCGGKLVYIRGRFPGHDNREVCPTCAVERLESIREISDKDYGRACQA